MQNDFMSYGDVARELDTTLARAKGLLKGLEPSLKAGNGRVVLFSRARVQRHLYEAHRDVISFIGYLSPSESYDMKVSVDAETSGK